MKFPDVIRTVGLVLLLLGATLLAPIPALSQEEPNLQALADSLFQEMSPEQRVGQLFLVTFIGDRAPLNSDIAELILNYHVGGVLLSSENDNLTGYGNPNEAPRQILELTNNLQQLALLGISDEPIELPEGEEEPLTSFKPSLEFVPVPLIIAVRHDGDSLPVNNIMPGYTALPNSLALGATWDPNYSQRIGTIVGQEMAATGINLLLGPSLDVLERPSPLNAGDLGTRSFGGDPFWVGVLGRAYIQGVHEGGERRVAVIARSFPGKGSSDRPVDVEVPTVRRSLDQLKQIELAPFFAVSRELIGSDAIADGFLTTHIRYQGLQGNIRATTAPVSLDPQALNSLMTLPELYPWRQSGGVIVSDSLGVRSVERFYDDTEREFPHRQVAKDALLAGNDLLNVSHFARGTANVDTELANIKDTISWFHERYETDPTFRQRVDESVMRILKLKLRLYHGDLDPGNVIISESEDETGPFQPIDSSSFFDIAESAITLLSPSQDELTSRFGSPPGGNNTIVIFTDGNEVQPCSFCEPGTTFSETAIQERIDALYGPSGSGQIQPGNIISFSFADLNEFLDAGMAPIPMPTTPPTPTVDPDDTPEPAPPETPEPTPTLPANYRVQEALRDADWIVFGLLNAGKLSGTTDSNALSRFLSLRPDLAGNRRVVVFAFDAPYFLDSTEISKLTAYYGVFSRTGAFVDAAVRALFLESPLGGSSPVSIDGIQYDLFQRTQPNPNQVIELFLVIGQEIKSPSSQEPLVTAIGNTLKLQTGRIVDRNGHTVPDGTLVRFILRNRVLGTITVLGDRSTTNGIAQLDYVLDASMGPGQFRITVESGEARLSQEVDISIEEDAQLAIIIPTPLPTETITPTPEPTDTPAPTATPSPPPPTATPDIASEDELGFLIRFDELKSLLGMFAGLATVGFVGHTINRRRESTSPIQRIGRLLWGISGGLLLYNYIALGLPGATWFASMGELTAPILIIVGGIIGVVLYRPSR